MKTISAVLIAVCVLFTACSKSTSPQWLRITKANPCTLSDGSQQPDCRANVFLLDTANITRKSGVLYVTMQTRTEGDPAEAGAYGYIRAEANCRSKKLEPSALHEDRYGADGRKTGSRLAVISAEDEQAVVKHACDKA